MRADYRRTSACTALACALLATPAAIAQGRDGTVARLVEVDGNVLVSRESGLASGNESLRLATGTRVITTANSKVVVEYDDGCRVTLKENQRFEVERGKPCALLVATDLIAAAGAPVVPLVVVGVLAGAGGAAVVDTQRAPRIGVTGTSVSPN